MSLKRGAGRGGIRAKRKECQQGFWEDTLQSERLVGLEGLTEWDKDSERVSNCVSVCVGAMFFYTILLFLDMQDKKLFAKLFLQKFRSGFGSRLEARCSLCTKL